MVRSARLTQTRITSPHAEPSRRSWTRVRVSLLRAGVARGREQREPLVLLHPFSLCSEVWTPVLPHLSQHHDVFALAIPGHPGSAPLPQGFRHSVEAAVDVIEANLDRLGIQRA